MRPQDLSPIIVLLYRQQRNFLFVGLRSRRPSSARGARGPSASLGSSARNLATKRVCEQILLHKDQFKTAVYSPDPGGTTPVCGALSPATSSLAQGVPPCCEDGAVQIPAPKCLT